MFGGIDMFLMGIPKIDDAELKRRYSRVKPVVTVKGKLHHLREYSLSEIKNTSYYDSRERDVRDIVPTATLEIWEGHDFPCLHPISYPENNFKPTVGDVLSQISQNDLWCVKAFEIIEAPQELPSMHSNTLRAMAYKNGFHVSMVRMYVSK
jgi:hypothetical protein